jgi:hypothetical protein
MRIGLDGQPPEQNVTNHTGSYGAFGAPVRHGRVVDRPPHGQVEPIASADMVEEPTLRLIKRGYIGASNHRQSLGEKHETAEGLVSPVHRPYKT